MMPSTICFALLSLTGGMFLLAKVNRDNLNLFFKVISWFVIIASFICIACTGLRTAMHLYDRRHGNRMELMMGDRFGEGGHGHHGWGDFGRRRHYYMGGFEGRFSMHDRTYMKDHQEDDGHMLKDTTSVMNKPDQK